MRLALLVPSHNEGRVQAEQGLRCQDDNIVLTFGLPRRTSVQLLKSGSCLGQEKQH